MKFVWLLFAAVLLCAQPKLDLGDVRETHAMVPMRDGAKLSVYLYTPPGAGPWPVLFEQRYADVQGASSRQRYARLAARGYVVAVENFRGTHLSEGVYVGYRALGWGEQRDGYDTVEWLARQPWSTGKIGTFGGSQAGYAQNFLAVTQPPHLVAQYITDGGVSLFHLGYRIGGTTRGRRFEAGMLLDCRDPAEGRRYLEEQFRHPVYDDYWRQEDCAPHFGKMNVPTFTLGSWFDFMSVGSIDTYIGRRHQGGPKARAMQQLLLGPWLHGGNKMITKVGEMEYPASGGFDVDEHMIRWFDFHLKGKPTGVDRDPAVRYYVMGAVGEAGAPGNVWKTAPDWPVPARDTSYYLQEGGGLALKQGAGKTEFLSDPAHPAPIPGRSFRGARDARDYERHPDVRTFTTEALERPVEWTGKVRAELYISSSAPDTDFIVRVTDVYPDGRSILIIDSIRRARFRDGFEREVFMKPGEVYKVAFDIGWLSQIFNRGHRIRISVGGTGADFYEPNPNTGEPFTLAPPAKLAVARNTLYHGAGRASRILAPVRE
jgi:predicted acyl esterase